MYMAGDVSYIYIMDHADNIIHRLYIGKMRYWMSPFSLQRYKFYDDSSDPIRNKQGTYYHLKRKANGRETYGVLHMRTVNEMRAALRDNLPMTEEEVDAQRDMQKMIDFVDEHLALIQANQYNIVFYTDHDF